MDIWFTSDTHFGHENILKFCERPFQSIKEHDEVLIENWNQMVKENDLIYVLGDFSYRAAPRYVCSILKRLNGKIHLVLGNHDKIIRKGHCLEYFDSIQDYLQFKHHKQTYALFHYPIQSWIKKNRGSIHLHGHCHVTLGVVTGENRMDVGIDGNNCFPYHLDEVHFLLENGDGQGLFQV